MPIYEYFCADCQKKQSIFFRSFASVQAGPACPSCGGRQLTRLISRTALVLSEDSRTEAMADGIDMSGVDENDPRSVARWARKMGKQMGGDELGEDFDEVVDELEEGGGHEGVETDEDVE